MAETEAKVDKRERKSYNVAPVKFVETWQNSESAQEVAEKLHMPKNIVLARAAVYRKPRKDGSPGVPLKRMPRKNVRGLDVAGLTKLVNGGASHKPEVDSEAEAEAQG